VSGVANRLQCTEAVYDTLQEFYPFKERGHIKVKGKGAMFTYFLVGHKQQNGMTDSSVIEERQQP
jgi:hypothetical protein